jgi:uncharacterized damage-inducible protein DinB
MPVQDKRKHFDLPDALLRAFATNDRINCFLVENLDEKTWRAHPPGGEGRTIGAIVSHMHNARLMWMKMLGHRTNLPAGLKFRTATRAQALRALPQSSKAIMALMRESLEGSGRLRHFPPDVAGFFTYMISHDAHHRGQILMLLRQLGYRPPVNVRCGVWFWSKRNREAMQG